MRRLSIIAAAIFIIALLLWKFSSQERSAAVIPPTNSVALNKTFSRPKALAPRPIEERGGGTNPVVESDEGSAMIKLSAEQVAAYLLKYKRSSESLLSAFDETHDPALLKEAVEKYPNDPRVQLAVLTQDTIDKKLTPEERKLWLDRLKESSPDNGLVNALAAMDDFNHGRIESGIAEVKSGNEKAGLSSFNAERLQSLEEMYLAAGLSPLEAKEQAGRNLLLPLEAKMKGIASQLVELQKNCLAAGDSAGAVEMAALATTLGRRWGDPNSSSVLITELVGMAMQRIALQNLDPNTYYGFLGKTAGERLAELKAQRAETTRLSADVAQYYPQMSEGDKLIFMDRIKLYGERNAWKWMRQMYGTDR